MDGAVIVDKPSGWTSHDVVNKVRRFAGTKKVGHLGTLDPAATGVLPLVIGRATRLAQFYTRNDKVYEGVIHFGYSTDSYDADGQPTSPAQDIVLDREQLEAALQKFRGPFAQVPPQVSAKKVAGRPAYEMARKQQPVELKAVDVEVYSLDVIRMEGVEAEVRVHCSAGTYLRSIAHEAGQALGCGAFLKSLRRTCVGRFQNRCGADSGTARGASRGRPFRRGRDSGRPASAGISRGNGGRAHGRTNSQWPRFSHLPVSRPGSAAGL